MIERDCTRDGECPVPGHTTLYRTAEWNPPPLHGQKITTWRQHRIVHEEWCHSVVGCSEPGHCTCDAATIAGENSADVQKIPGQTEATGEYVVHDLIEEARAFVERNNGLNWQGMVSRLADALEDAEESRELAAEAAKAWREKANQRVEARGEGVLVEAMQDAVRRLKNLADDIAERDEARSKAARLEAAAREARDVVQSASVPLGMTEAWFYRTLLGDARRILTNALKGEQE